MSESQQSVVDDVNGKAKPSTETNVDAQGNGDDLEKLLAEFDDSDNPDPKAMKEEKPSKPAKTEQKTETPNDLSSQVQKLLDMEEERRREEFQRQFDADMAKTVVAIRGEISDKLASDKLVRAWIEATAEENPKLTNAWVNRKKDPKAFGRIVEKLSRDFAAEFSKRPDPNATEDREVVSAAVRGASTKTPEDKAPNYASMSDQEFAADVEKKFGFRPKV
jgi:hypothetical protein